MESFVCKIFCAAGLAENHAARIAGHLVLANLRGVDSHGVSRLRNYIDWMRNGLVSKPFEPQVERESASSLLLNGNNAFGILLASHGIRLAVQKAKQTGVSIVGIHHSNHCGMLADYTMYAAQNDCIALAITNAPPYMAPWGGRERFFGTNPFSYGIPVGPEVDIIFDMATSIVARGKILLAKKNNQPIPIGWAISKEGKPTTNPDEALEGMVLPVGGPKGYGLALLVEILSALFTGAAFGPNIPDLFEKASRPQNIGQCFIVMRADLFQDLDAFKNRMVQMIQEIRNIKPMEDVERIYLPGEIEKEIAKEREKNGIPLSVELVKDLVEVGRQYGITAL